MNGGTLESAQVMTKTILVVDDDAAVRELVGCILERGGYSVLRASDGEEALSLVETRNEAPDLVITDLVMPGLTGTELADHLTSWNPAIRVLFISGYPGEMVSRTAITAGRFLQKPFATDTLLEKVRELLG